MTNKEIFVHNALSEFEIVQNLYLKGCTESSEWKDSIEKLIFSLEVTLRDMRGE